MIVADPHTLVDQIAQRSRVALVYMSPEGVCMAMDGGAIVNLTRARVLFPKAERVNILFRQQDGVNQFVGVADSAGSPASNARIGDYVDAEIRRFQGA